jgi:hypothetical protein
MRAPYGPLPPPGAILDPEACEEYGTPRFAIHSGMTGVATGGGGMTESRGSVKGMRGNALSSPAEVSKQAGALKFQDADRGGLLFTNHQALWLPKQVCVWACFQPTTSSIFNTIASNAGSGATHGWELNISSGNTYRFGCSGASFVRYISTDFADTSTPHQLMAGADIQQLTWMPMYVDGKLQTNTGEANPGTPTYASPFRVGARGGDATIGAQMLLWHVIVWDRLQPKELAFALLERPDLYWWWPGKSRRRYYIVNEQAAGQPVLRRYGGVPGLQHIPSGRRG